jgi:putative SOS response-associated peptidase YedK
MTIANDSFIMLTTVAGPDMDPEYNRQPVMLLHEIRAASR